jgi:hypothetical protein
MRTFWVTLLLLSTARAQTDNSGLKNRLLKQPLYLRGMWASDDLHFDGTGHLLTSSENTSFTLSGIEIVKVQLKGDGLNLIGKRVGLELAGDTPKRVVLTLGQGRSIKEEEIHIQIARPASADYKDALTAIFAPSIDDLVPDLPSYWQFYAAKNVLHVPPPTPWLGGGRPLKVGGSVTEPIVAKSVEPEFNAYARSMLYQGKVQVRFVLGADARPSNFVIVQPLGLGLDELAVSAIKQYVFGPATFHGKSVPVELEIEANFQITR